MEQTPNVDQGHGLPEDSIGDGLQESLYAIRHSLNSLNFTGNALSVLVEELQFTLDAPCVVLQQEHGQTTRMVCSVSDAEREFIEQHGHVSAVGRPAGLSVQQPLSFGTWQIETNPFEVQSTVDGYWRPDSNGKSLVPIRREIEQIRCMVSCRLLATNRTEPLANVYQIEIYLKEPRVTHHSALMLAHYLDGGVSLVEGFFPRATLTDSGGFMPGIGETSVALSTGFVDSALAETSQRLRPVIAKTSQQVRDPFLLQFFVVTGKVEGRHRLRFLPLLDQRETLTQLTGDLSSTLSQIGLREDSNDVLGFATRYTLSGDTSFAGYVCDTGCATYVADWPNEPLIRAEHLVERDAEKRERAAFSAITSRAQEMRNAQSPDSSQQVLSLLTIPLFVGEQAFGALQVNSSLPLSRRAKLDTIRAVREMVLSLILRAGQLQVERLAALGQLAARAAYQFRQTLGALAPSLKDLGGWSWPSLARKRLVQAFEGAIKDGDRIVEDLTIYAHGVDRKPGSETQPSDLGECVTSVLFLLRDRIKGETPRRRARNPEKPINLKVNVQPGLRVLVESRHLKQVLYDVVLNAVEAMDSRRKTGDAELSIEARREDSQVQVVVSDTGVGIDPGYLKSVCLPFETRKVMGIGLGLFVCKSIVEQYAGSISLESELGRGTRVSITLPLGKSTFIRDDEAAEVG